MSAEPLSIPRAALHGQVTQRLRQMLVEGQIVPGAKLNERALCEEL
ncbi:MAG: GntR family transcriptional regulator, partial [Hylemonella sp.]|nr:GntR family transcriptional regulator [Hylemonella sp.]